MKERFYVSKGRYEPTADSRFKRYTHGIEKLTINSPINHEDKETITHGSYGALLFDERWKAKRQEILKRDENCCVICKSSVGLQVHHRQYHIIKATQQFKSPWDYENHLLITFCETCHRRGHSKFKVPTITI